MVQSLQLGTPDQSVDRKGMKRLNRVPLFFGLGILLLFLAVLVYGLSSRGFRYGKPSTNEAGGGIPASTFADQLKRGIKDGIIGDEAVPQPVFQPSPVSQPPATVRPVESPTKLQPADQRKPRLETDEDWNARMLREQREQIFREQQRQRMASLQAKGAAFDSPLKVETGNVSANAEGHHSETQTPTNAAEYRNAQDLYSEALKAGTGGQIDQNGQTSKEDFFNADIKELGYLPGRVVPLQSRFELKRGSVIPATLITGINSDLPGRITAQISQNVYDSATGHFILVPQGAKLLGRYDSKVSFGQNRALVIWTDIIFPNGATLQIGGMAGTDSEGYGGFNDKIDNHYLRTFGSAALVALIGTGIDMSLPESSTRATQDTASDAARRNFAEGFGRVAEQTISKNLNVQPTIRIRPGYRFNVLVDQDVIFPGSYAD